MIINPTNTALSVKDLTVVYHQKPVIWDLDFYAPTSCMMAIIGPNGSGKTTLIKSILGIIKPVTGIIKIFNQPASYLSNQIAYVPQKNSVDWTFPINVFDVVLMARLSNVSFFSRPSAHDCEIAENALEMVGMIDFKMRHISQLSGGQQQRVFLARALAQQLPIFLLDEPFIGVDMMTEHLILKILQDLQQQGKTIVVVHHDLNTVAKYFNWTFMMNVKHIALGPTQDILTDCNMTKTFYTPERHDYF